tara:strand:+ start:54 stop:230 length:177 start_codon:yes stop_codon:yes gene_type:complete
MNKSNQSKGLGDSIDKFTKFTGIKSFANMATRAAGVKDCGCNKRRKWLNKQFPYKNKE